MNIKISKEKYSEIIKYYEYGYSLNKIAEIYKVTSVAIQRILIKNNIKRRNSGSPRIYSVNHNFLNKINTPEKAYFLGWAFSDGYNNEKRRDFHLSLQEEDKEILLKLNSILETNQPLLFIKSKNYKHKNLYRISIRSHQLSLDLAKLGCYQCKSKTLQLPKLKNNLMRYFIRAYFEGDGCLNFYFVNGKRKKYLNSQFYICSGSIEMIKQLSKFLSKKLLIPIYFIKQNTVFYLKVYGIKHVLKIMNYIYNKKTNLVLRRKYNYFKKLKKIYIKRINK